MAPTDIEIMREPELVAAEQARAALARVPTVDVEDALVLRRDPNVVLAEATKAAKALMAVMAQKPDKVMMNGQQYIENEDWLVIGHFYGVTAQIESDRFVEFGPVQGWEATAVLIARDGRMLGRATAMCLNDEEKWSGRPKKEWAYCLAAGEDHSAHGHVVEDPGPGLIVWIANPNKPGKNMPQKYRMTTGEEKVPFFQLRSMAQTRASSKVHASVLRFVPVLAGFKATPSEELPDAERVPNQPKAEVMPSDDDNQRMHVRPDRGVLPGASVTTGGSASGQPHADTLRTPAPQAPALPLEQGQREKQAAATVEDRGISSAPTAESHTSPVVTAVNSGVAPSRGDIGASSDAAETVYAPVDWREHESSLPAGAVLLTKVTRGWKSKAVGYLKHSGQAVGAEELAIYKQPMLEAARAWCVEGTPVEIELASPPSGKPYVKSLTAYQPF